MHPIRIAPGHLWVVAIMPNCPRQLTCWLRRSAFLAVQAALLLGYPFDRAFAWGQEGHSIVAELTERRLDADTLRKIKVLLGGVSMASVASWADDYRGSHPETGGWHFVDIPFDQNAYDPGRGCKPEKGDCIIHSI